MNDYRIRFEISATGQVRTALVAAETPGEAVQLVLADHGAICLLHLETLPPARGVAPAPRAFANSTIWGEAAGTNPVF